jgi:hypothetical protein
MELWEGNGNYFGAYTKTDKAGHYLQNSSSFFGAVIEADESSFWGYDPSGYNFKTVASNTQTLMELWESGGNYFGAYTKSTEAGHYLQNGNSFLGGVIKSSESSLWGYTGGGPNYMLKSTGWKADLQLWSGGGATTSAWATGSDAGVKVEKGGDFSFVDMGKLWMELGGGEFYGYGGGLYIKRGNWVDIQPPSDNAYFQKVTYVNSNWELQTREFLCTGTQDGEVPGGCDAIVKCVVDSNIFPTWSEANAAYVDWGTLKSYPTWTETNQTYVDWGTLKSYPTWTETNQTYVDWQTLNNALLQVMIAAQSEVLFGLLKLGVDASCDNGNLTVKLTGLPETSGNTPNWPTNLGPGMGA